MKERGKNLIAIMLICIIIYSISLLIWVYHYVPEKDYTQATGKVQSVVSLCINSPPYLNVSTCPANVTQGTAYVCKLNTTDLNNNTVTISATFITIDKTFSNTTTEPFTVASNGNISFTPTNDDVGTYSLNTVANDNLNCGNSLRSAVFNLTIINLNDAPILIRELEDVEYEEDELIFAFSLDNYFDDPDLDNLTYTASGNINISIQILPTSEVIISSTSCGFTENVIFSAIDPFNATNYSNIISITCNEDNTIPPSTSTSQSAGSSGGSGGGSSSLLCRSEFICYDYHMCNATNQKIQRCVDSKGCKDEEFITLPCLYNPLTDCSESWSCSEWEQCTVNGTRTRSCTDTNLCGTNVSIPYTRESCEYIGTCNDGIKNCHDNFCEEEIDCGGPCGACKTVQVPYPFQEERGWGIYITSLIILLLLMAILSYHYFKKKIDSIFAKAGWFVNKNKRKQYLITLIQRNQILESLEKCEKMVDKKEPIVNVVNIYENQIKFYISNALKIPELFEKNDIVIALNKKKMTKIISKIILSTYDDYQSMIKTESKINNANIKRMIEELRTIAIHTAPKGTYTKEIQELKTEETFTPVQKIETHLVNAYIALEFLEIEAAKKKYMEILNEYAKVSIKDEEQVYEDVKRLYDNITYVNGWAGLEG